MFKKLMVAVALSFAGSACAEQALDCSQDGTTIEMNECAEQKLTEMERTLTLYFEKSLALQAEDEDTAKALRASQKAWQGYKDAYCDAVYMHWRDGSIRNLMSLSCQQSLTQQRTVELWADFIKESDDSETPLANPATQTSYTALASLPGFTPWEGQKVPQGDLDPESYLKKRLGTLTLAADASVYVDFVENLHHFPSFYHWVDKKSGKVLSEIPVFSEFDAKFNASNDGRLSLESTHLSLCGERYTRQFLVKNTQVKEVLPALYTIERDTSPAKVQTEVLSAVTLFSEAALKSGQKITTLPAQTSVTVLGVKPQASDSDALVFLLQTPEGLVGWHRQDDKRSTGSLEITECN